MPCTWIAVVAAVTLLMWSPSGSAPFREVAITIDEASAPGGQDGLLGMALHPELLKGTGQDFVYVVYTYVDRGKGPDMRPRGPTDLRPRYR